MWWTKRVCVVVWLSGVVACGPPAPPTFVGKPTQKPINVVVRVSDEAAATNDFGGTASLVETLTQGLEERGIQTRLFLRDDDAPPPPRIELKIEKWDTGDVQSRDAVAGAGVLVSPLGGAIARLAMAGEYVVVCEAFKEGDAKAAYVRRFDGPIAGPGLEFSSRIGESLGETVLRAILNPDGPPPRAERW